MSITIQKDNNTTKILIGEIISIIMIKIAIYQIYKGKLFWIKHNNSRNKGSC